MGKGKSLISKDEMAAIYAGLIFQADFDFANLNKKIINQWSFSALKEIKNRAWKIAKRLTEWEKLNTTTELKERKGR